MSTLGQPPSRFSSGSSKSEGLLGQSFTVGRILGIRIRIHVTFVLFIAYELMRGQDAAGTARFMALIFGSVLLHEFGHSLACRKVGGIANDIVLWPLGGLAYCVPPKRPWAHFVTVVWGPMVNVILAAGSYAILLAVCGSRMPVSLDP